MNICKSNEYLLNNQNLNLTAFLIKPIYVETKLFFSIIEFIVQPVVQLLLHLLQVLLLVF